MERIKIPISVKKEALFCRYEKELNYIRDKRSTHIDFYEGQDDQGAYVLPVIRYNIFDTVDDVYHGFSSRIGGVSSEHLSSLNLSFSRGDKKENVMTNHKRLGAAMGYDIDTLVFSDQVHEKAIYIADETDMGKGIISESDIRNVDGLLTNTPGVTLITFYADCVPNFFYDPVKKVVGLAHSGWKGTVNGIGGAMIENMGQTFGTRAEDVICAIGPSICKSCYEVSGDVAAAFMEKYSGDECRDMLFDKGNGKYLLDLHAACRYNLLNAGVLSEHIAMPDLCTCCNPQFLYSHRASGGMRGNLAAVIGIKKDVE